MPSMANRWVKTESGVMVEAKRLADFVFPDTPTGRDECQRLMSSGVPLPEEVAIAFCTEYTIDQHEPRVCGNRKPAYRDGMNPCRRCPAGYLFDVMMGTLPDEFLMPFDALKENEDGEESV